MKATIKYTNPRRQMYSALVDGCDYTVFELMEWVEIKQGDIISGDLNSHGDTVVRLIGRDESVSIFIENMRCSEQRAL